MKRKGAISNTGYKSNSKDRFNDFNLIPSNRITMKGVDNPLLMIPMGDRGVGNPVMGVPGEEYFFPNYDMVMEMRLPKGASHMNYQRLQNGGIGDPSKAFLSNWYTNRNIPDPYIQGAYELDRPMYMRNLQNFPDYTVVPSIDNDPRITGRYDSNNGKVFLTPNAPSHVKTHELNHFMNMGNDAGGYMRTIHGDIVRNELKPKSELSGVYSDKYDYFANPDEVHSRIMVLREKAKLKPNEVVTPEKLDKFMKKYKGDVDNINDLLNLSKDKNALLNMLNYMAANDRGQSLYTAQIGG